MMHVTAPAAPRAQTPRNEVFRAIVDTILSGGSVDLVGDYGSGRTHLLQRVRQKLRTMGWKTIDLFGIEALRSAPLNTLALAGFVAPVHPRAANWAGILATLEQQLDSRRTCIVIDDSDCVDEASWGLINALRMRTSVPVLAARMRARDGAQSSFGTTGYLPTYTVNLDPMRHAELGTALESVVNYRLNSGALSRVFAKSGGNIGVAIALSENARLAGNLMVTDGIAHASGPMWTRSLQHLIETILRPLTPQEIDALRSLSALGPTEVDVAARAVPGELLRQLEHLGFVTVLEAAGVQYLSINPPVLVEHFRAESSPAQRVPHDDGAGRFPLDAAPDDQERSVDKAAFVRLVHSTASERSASAKEAWLKAPSLATAAAFLEALDADVIPHDDEVAAVVREASSMTGAPADHARWGSALATQLAYRFAAPDRAIAALREAAEKAPSSSLELLGRATALEIRFHGAAMDEPFADALPLDDPDALREVVAARGLWLLAQGRIPSLIGLLSAFPATGPRTDSRVAGLHVHALLAADRTADAIRVAKAHLQHAMVSLDARRIRNGAYLNAVSMLLSHQSVAAQEAVDLAVSLGFTESEPTLSSLGLTLAAAELCAARGDRSAAKRHLDQLSAQKIGDGPLPAMHPSLVIAMLQALDGDSEGAAQTQMGAGDELWSRGFRLAAAYAYLDAVRSHPTPHRWSMVAERIAAVDSPAVRRASIFVEALTRADVATLIAETRAAHRSGETALALALARSAARHLENHDQGGVIEEFASAAGVSSMSLKTGDRTDVFTPRELEGAELVAAGLTNPMIAEALVVSVRTVESHLNRVMRKIGARHRRDVGEYLRGSGGAFTRVPRRADAAHDPLQDAASPV